MIKEVTLSRPVVRFSKKVLKDVTFNPDCDFGLFNVVGRTKDAPCYYVTVKNTENGRKFLEDFKRLNREHYRFNVRGRHSNRRIGRKLAGLDYTKNGGSSNDLRVKGSERFVIYLIPKKEVYGNWNTQFKINFV